MGEGDHRQLIDGRVATREDLDDAPDERGGLAGAGPGLDQEVLFDVRAYLRAHGGVDGLVGGVAAGSLDLPDPLDQAVRLGGALALDRRHPPHRAEWVGDAEAAASLSVTAIW